MSVTKKNEFLQKLGLEEMLEGICAPTNCKTDPLMEVSPWEGSFACSRPISVRIGGVREQLICKIMRLVHGDMPYNIAEPRLYNDAELVEFAAAREKTSTRKTNTIVISRLRRDRVQLEARRWLVEDWIGDMGERPLTEEGLYEWMWHFEKIKNQPRFQGKITKHAIDWYGNGFLLEIKGTADTDNNKSKSVVIDDIMTSCAVVGDFEAKTRLLVGYDNTVKDAPCSEWDTNKKRILKHLDRSLVVFEDEFYNTEVLPSFVRWADISSIVRELIRKDHQKEVLERLSPEMAMAMMDDILEAQFNVHSAFESFDILAQSSDRHDRLFARKKLKS